MRSRKPLPGALDDTSMVIERPQPERTDAIQMRRRLQAARLLASGVSRDRFIDAMSSDKLQPVDRMSSTAARNLYYDILGEWKKDYETEIPYHRASAIRRIQNDLATMRSERVNDALPKNRRRPTWNDIARHEAVLARMTGVNTPVNVRVLDVNETIREGLTEVLEEMTPDEMMDILAEGEGLDDDA